MNDHDIQNRFEELEAGHILGDLDAGEIKEWELLSKDPRCKRDFSLELTAAAVEAEFLQSRQSELPQNLKEKLRTGIAGFVAPAPVNVVSFPAWRRILSAPQFAWGIAATFAILLVAKTFFQEPQSVQPPPLADVALPPAEAKSQLMRMASDLKESDFGGRADYGRMTGKVIWSDALQEGYLTLTNLPVNDPAVKQYQLWIVDPKFQFGIRLRSAIPRLSSLPWSNPAASWFPSSRLSSPSRRLLELQKRIRLRGHRIGALIRVRCSAFPATRQAGRRRYEVDHPPFSPPPVRPRAHSTAFTPKAIS
jgi:hypothetical protein